MLFIARNIDALIPLLGGAYATYLAYRGIPASTTKRVAWEQWYARWGRMLRWLGPLVMLFGLAQLIVKALPN